jgi:hypothetical protein
MRTRQCHPVRHPPTHVADATNHYGLGTGASSAGARYPVASSPRTPPETTDHRADAFSGLARVLVLPHSYHGPPLTSQPPISVDIPTPGLVNLGRPKLAVLGRRPIVVRATVPKAAVEEHRDPLPRKDQVRRASHALQRTRVHPVAHTERMDRRPQSEFRPSVAAPVTAHDRSNGGRCRP